MSPVKKVKHTEIKKIINHFLHRPNITHSLKKKYSRKRVDGVVNIWYERLHFFQRRHAKFYYEDTLQNSEVYL